MVSVGPVTPFWEKETAREIDADQPSDAFDRVVEEMGRPISYDSEKKMSR
jgi:hypothetical protein